MHEQDPPGRAGQTLLDAIFEEQAARWKRGERPMLEDYLASHPSLRDAAEAVVDLVYHEYLIRRQLGEPASPEEYVRRFPACAEALVQQFAVDEVLDPIDPRKSVLSSGAQAAKAEEPAAAHAEGQGKHALPLPEIAGYDVLEELGRGGMGIVYKARDRQLGRIVAIKMIAEAAHARPAHLERFLAEAEVVARLKHANIIAIHAISQEAGRPFISLEFAERGSLAQLLAQGPISARQAAELVEALSHAVGAAHQAGIIHRDLKPSNVLLTAQGIPKIGDFGLAKLLGDESARTLSGEILGTPSYMAPEQAEGRSREVGAAADIYALGSILYQALTGRPPFLGASAVETLKLVATAEVVPPRRQRPEMSRDLETICLKCLEKEPGRRYADAEALGEDLRRFLEGRPITARPIGAIGRLARWGRRNPGLAATIALLMLTFAVGSPTLLGLWLRARAYNARAEYERGRADDQRARADDQRARAERERDRAERSRDRAISAVRLLLETRNEVMLSEELRPYRQTLVEAGMRESLALVEDLEGDPRAELQRLQAYGALARIQFAGGDKAAAAATLRKAIILAESLVNRNTSDRQARRALAESLHLTSAVREGDDEAPALAQRSNEIFQSLRREAPGDSPVPIAMNHFNLGNLHAQEGRSSLALPEFLAAREAYDEAIAQGDRSPKTVEFAARNLMYLCRLFGTAQPDESLAAGRRAQSILQSLVREHPDRYESAMQLAFAQQELGNHLLAAERVPEAVPCFEAVRHTLKDLVARHGRLVSRMARIQGQIVVADYNLMAAYESDPVKYARACRELAAEAHEICNKLSLVQPLEWNQRITKGFTAYALADCFAEDALPPNVDLLVESERTWTEMLCESPKFGMARTNLVVVRRRLADELRAMGRDDEAKHWERCALETARGDPERLYAIAVDYARKAGLVGKCPTKLNSQQLCDRRRRFAAEAEAMLRQAVADGFKDVARLRTESQLDAIRADVDFRAIVAELEFPDDPFAP